MPFAQIIDNYREEYIRHGVQGLFLTNSVPNRLDSTMRFTAALALLVASAGLVRALDNFLLYTLPPQVNLTQFTTAYV